MAKHGASAIRNLLTFSVIEDAPVAAISPDIFFRKFEDAGEWEKLSHEMDLYFFDRIEFFPALERTPHRIDLHHFVPRRGKKSNKYRKIAQGEDNHENRETSVPNSHATAPEKGEHNEAAGGFAHSEEPKERLIRPRRYFEIETELIERRFPADKDIREHFKTLRSYFCHNLIRYLTYKRAILLLSIVIFL